MKASVIALCIIAVATSACAQTRVLMFGDSQLDPNVYPAGTSVSALLQAARPDLIVTTNAAAGRHTVEAQAIMQAQLQAGDFDVGVVLIGVNDFFFLTGNDKDPKETAKRVRSLAAKLRNDGADEIILTYPPGIPAAAGYTAEDYTRDMDGWLYHLNGAGVSYRVEDLRDQFSADGWRRCGTALDGLHWLTQDCRQLAADFIADQVP